MLKVTDLKSQLRGRWEPVLLALAPELGPAIERAPRHVPCPVHGGRDGFRLFKNWEEDGGGICNTCGCFPDGFELIRWLRGWQFKEVLAEVARAAGGGILVPLTPRCPMPSPSAHSEQILAKMKDLWQGAAPLVEPEAEPARLYLVNRGIEVFDVPSLRCHLDLPYYEEGKEVDRYPALLGLFLSPEKQGVTLHRIYLTKDGRKAPVSTPKKTMPVPWSPEPIRDGYPAWSRRSDAGSGRGYRDGPGCHDRDGANLLGHHIGKFVGKGGATVAGVSGDYLGRQRRIQDRPQVSLQAGGPASPGAPKSRDPAAAAAARSQDLGLGGCVARIAQKLLSAQYA